MPPELSTVAYWEKRFANKQTQWHINEPHPALVKHLESLTEGQPKNILVNLCGKTVDIPYLLSLGHKVFGVDGVHQAIEELQEENSLKLNFDKEKSVYYSDDGRLEIYCGDHFKFPAEKFGPFDIIWDRAALLATDYSTRHEYAGVVRRCVLRNDGTYHNFKFLLQTYEYDRNLYPGPPTSMTATEVEECFGSWTKVKKIDTTGSDTGMPTPKESTSCVLYLMTPRTL